jgi:outer membrane protein
MGGEAQTVSSLTLDDAIALALSRHPEMRVAAAGEDAAGARTRQVQAGFLPRVDLVEGWQRSDHPVFVFSALLAQRRFTAPDFALDRLNNPGAASNFRAGIVVEQTIFDGFRTRGMTRAAHHELEAARFETVRVGDELRLSVVTAFGRAVTSQAIARTARSTVTATREDLRRAVDRRDAGLETEASVLAFRVRIAEAEAGEARAGADASIARASLNALLGSELDDDRPLAPLTAPRVRERTSAALEAEAVHNRPEIRIADALRQKAIASMAAARASFWPVVVAQGGAEANGARIGDRTTAWSAAVQLRWNLFAGGADAARVAEADAQVRRAAAERERLETAIRLSVRTALADHQVAVARETTSRQMVEQAHESQRIIRDRYEEGLAPATDLLRAAELLSQAEAARIAASIDINVTAAALERAVGRAESKP